MKGSIQRLNHKSFADAVKSGILTRANSLPIRQSVFKRVVFPDNAWGSRVVHPERHLHGQPQSSSRRASDNSREAVNSEQGKTTDWHLVDLNLNLGLRNQPLSALNLSETKSPRICSWCFLDRHARRDCKSEIRCHNCLHGGHIAVNCLGQWRLDRGVEGINQQAKQGIKGKAPLEQPKWFSKAASMSLGPSTSNAPAFNSFTDWWYAGLALQTVPELPEPRVIPWNLPPKLMTDGPSTAGTHRVESATWVNEVLHTECSYIFHSACSTAPYRCLPRH